MSNETLEARLKSLEGEIGHLKEHLEEKDKQLQTLNDIEDIKRLQCAYGYYLERWMGEEIVDLFSTSPEVSATFFEGTFKGIEGIRRFFIRFIDISPGFLHHTMQISPIITVDSDGPRAKGRWYGYGVLAFSPIDGTIDPMYESVVYEMEYIKEDGVWKILKLVVHTHYIYSPRRSLGGSVNTPLIPDEVANAHPDEFAEYETLYPSGYILPHHFKHPVTGKVTSEVERNAKLKLKPNRFRPA